MSNWINRSAVGTMLSREEIERAYEILSKKNPKSYPAERLAEVKDAQFSRTSYRPAEQGMESYHTRRLLFYFESHFVAIELLEEDVLFVLDGPIYYEPEEEIEVPAEREEATDYLFKQVKKDLDELPYVPCGALRALEELRFRGVKWEETQEDAGEIFGRAEKASPSWQELYEHEAKGHRRTIRDLEEAQRKLDEASKYAWPLIVAALKEAKVGDLAILQAHSILKEGA